jgi:hypothetical protein
MTPLIAALILNAQAAAHAKKWLCNHKKSLDPHYHEVARHRGGSVTKTRAPHFAEHIGPRYETLHGDIDIDLEQIT